MAARRVAVVGGGPAGLIAAEALAGAGAAATVFDAMPSVGRKFLMAGRGGLNLTHGEPLEAFLGRYDAARDRLAPAIAAFPPAALIRWCEGLDQPTFVGSSGRVFPRALKASPLLRAWLARLAARGVTIHTRRRWTGWGADGALTFAGPGGAVESVTADATLLALGGASWPRLGADGAWIGL
ncbi:MAG: NAD(P)/FAD-dependent oxidoreductase, partial [Rhodospirillales bacterium]|nr:NAD(P)/FAD-dependent oxidoreductase [Rhodospirillales bacterium]